VRRTGIYLLVGPDPDDSSRQLVYIGEGDNVNESGPARLFQSTPLAA
jgi:hypothetical protein